ncbi:DUF2156 domain-containing protein [Crassaminicella profunda]|uniref:DUF2156 domain-containing protein n=1 Tax=Crassaminicella profunda TaxID=1286698 RepID=UPI001CA722CD|nr:phosphatidylglycerol lysyltransferase domain-containing protein [Crassaminicella profunda]QZY55432.1 phosphatidylglycerol lysyltransferase domain-containing protein [Crassaminicella profunda]
MFKNNITLKDQALFEKYICSYPYKTSGLTFTSLFMWRHLNEFKYEIIHDFLCISGINHLNMNYKEFFVLPPLSIKEYNTHKLSLAIDEIKNRFEEIGHPFNIKLLPKHMIETFKKANPNLNFTPDAANFDYVYLAEDLIGLKGRKLHSKKNHFNYFMRNTPHKYVSLTDQLIEDCLRLNTRLLESKDYTSLEAHLIDLEQMAVYEALKNRKALGAYGGAILINDQVEAFTLGAKLDEETMVVHIEKANTKFRGLYQAINQQFCNHSCIDVTYVNREEDMGLPNLKKAKESYRPIKMIEKYDGTFNK